ncbi:MAG: ATP-binding cassette domain-containing protein [Pseudomonadota bacterium]
MRDTVMDIAPEAKAVSLLLHNLSLAVDGQPLLRDLTLSLPARGTTVIMGANGAGKSLLLRVLHGLVPPTRGEIRWSGQPPSRDLTRTQSLVFQKPVLLRRSVAANVDFVLRSRGRHDPVLRDATLEQVGLTDRAKVPARRLSGGEQQRLALARALVTRPVVLMLDEPTASLDPASTLKIEQIVQDAAKNGTKVLFVTHDVGQARRLADDVVFLHRGRLAEQAPATHFFDAPTSDAACAYLAGRIDV